MPTATEKQPRTALVLASSKGLGASAAAALGGRGNEIILQSRGGPALQQTQVSIPQAVATYEWDLAAREDTRYGVARLLADGHRPTILICNCGGPPPGNFETLHDAQWDAGFQSILRSPLEAIQALLPIMREEGFGRIVMISSITAREPIPDLVLSSVFRAGLAALVKCLSTSLAEDGITVNAVLPGYASTERLKAFEGQLASIRENIPLKRFANPEEVAALIAFLCSDEASYVTGQSITCDGGLVRAI